MDTQHHQKIKEHIQKSQQVGIAVGKNPNLDHMAAGLGLYLSLKNIGKNVTIASPTDPIVEVSNLVGIDKVKKTLATDAGDLIISFPYQEGDVEKVSYNIDESGNSFNLVIKAGEKGLKFHEKEIVFKRGGKVLHLLFVIGVPNLSDITNIYTPEMLKDTVIVNIDNKVENQNFGDIVIVSPKFSSISEQIADFLTLPDSQLPIDTDIAQNLLSGITFATNDFQDPRTSHLAFEMAGILMRKGAIRNRHMIKEERKPQSSFTPRPQQVSRPAPAQHPIQHTQPQQMQRPIQQSPQQFQPVSNTTQTPPQSVSSSQPIQQSEKQAPADWLQPKVYKGSTFS